MTYQNDYLQKKYKATTTRNNKITRVLATTSSPAREPRYNLRKYLAIGSIVLVLTSCVFWQPLSDVATVAFSSASSDLKKVSIDAGLNMHGRAIFLSNDPEFVDANRLSSVCPHDQEFIEFGCYLATSHKIYILEVGDAKLQPIELTAIAHETLHAAWDKLNANNRQSIGSQLTVFYNSKLSEVLTTGAEPYKNASSNDFTNELHSLAGSEVDSSMMPGSLRNHFEKYFSNQYASVSASSTFSQNIDSQITNINSRKKQLDEENTSLDNFKAKYLDGIKAYMRQNLYYGDITTYNKNVDAYNHNLEIYKNKVDQYNSNVNSYNADKQKFIDAYTALFPNKTIPVDGSQ